MKWTAEHTAAAVALGWPNASDEKRSQECARREAELADDPTFESRARVLLDGDRVVAAVRAVHWYRSSELGETWFGNIDTDPELTGARLVPLLEEWRVALRSLPTPPYKLVHRVRLPLDGPEDAPLLPREEALESVGWTGLGERREFKNPLSELPTEDPASPLVWHDLERFGRERAAEMIDDGGRGPEWEDGDDAEALIDSALSDTDLVHTPACIQIATLDGEPVGFVIAQSSPESGWGTVKLVGVCRAARGRGLGVAIHRHAFSMLRAQGGKTYHDGTSAVNVPMLRVFEKNGCTPFLRLRGWEWGIGSHGGER